MLKFGIILILAALTPAALSSHIDDTNGELSNLAWNKVVFRTMKDCSLDKLPGVRFYFTRVS